MRCPNLEGSEEAPATAKDWEVKKRRAADCMSDMAFVMVNCSKRKDFVIGVIWGALPAAPGRIGPEGQAQLQSHKGDTSGARIEYMKQGRK